MFELDVEKRAQINLNGLIKIITGVISQSEQGTEDVSPRKAKYQKLSNNNTAMMFIPHQCLTSFSTFFSEINFTRLIVFQLQQGT